MTRLFKVLFFFSRFFFLSLCFIFLLCSPLSPLFSISLRLGFADLSVVVGLGFAGSAKNSRPITVSNTSLSSSTRLMSLTMTALALRVTMQRGSVSVNKRRRMARREESSFEDPSKNLFSWQWMVTWNEVRTVVAWRWVIASGIQSLTSTSIIGRRGQCRW